MYVSKRDDQGVEYKDYLPLEKVRIGTNFTALMPVSVVPANVRDTDELGIIVDEVEVQESMDLFYTDPVADIF